MRWKHDPNNWLHDFISREGLGLTAEALFVFASTQSEGQNSPP